MSTDLDILLVRHGEAAAAYGEDDDPGLSDLGRSQSALTAIELQRCLPLIALTSPLARARQTAKEFTGLTGIVAEIDDRFSEIPTPASLSDRQAWLQPVLRGHWSQQDASLHAWRQTALAALSDIQSPTVVFCHFVIINAMVAAVTDDDRVTCFMPANASITRLKKTSSGLQLVSLGAQLKTMVN
jgi:broad specificity phosphatase PhoE